MLVNYICRCPCCSLCWWSCCHILILLIPSPTATANPFAAHILIPDLYPHLVFRDSGRTLPIAILAAGLLFLAADNGAEAALSDVLAVPLSVI